jgi:hypothetical protein
MLTFTISFHNPKIDWIAALSAIDMPTTLGEPPVKNWLEIESPYETCIAKVITVLSMRSVLSSRIFSNIFWLIVIGMTSPAYVRMLRNQFLKRSDQSTGCLGIPPVVSLTVRLSDTLRVTQMGDESHNSLRGTSMKRALGTEGIDLPQSRISPMVLPLTHSWRHPLG